MRSLPYSDLEKGVASIAGIDPTNLLSHEKVLIAEYISDAVKYCWDYYPWAEFTKTEERYFREVFEPNKQYLAGDEVYFSDAYYRARVDVQASTVDLSSGKWYEVGDTSSATKWSETGCYYIGARVEYNDKYYVCISEPTDSIGAYGNQPCCFEINAIDPTDTTYFAEIENNVFDRYIAYEQAGKDVIGTTLSVTLSDPRYNDTKPLNWREDREGIYIDPEGNSFNSVYIRYRLEAPTYTFESTTDEVPKFLAQAIKAFAYKSWLIGDGQHEKAQLQDIYGLDLLLREVDRLDLQQDRAQPFTITKNPYRRVNARQGIQASETTAQIASVKKSNVVVSIELTTDAQGFNPVKKAIIDGDPIFDIIVEGYNAVQKGLPVTDLNIGLACNGENAVKPGYANSFVKIFTGIPFWGVDIGQLQGLKLNVVRESVQPINLTLRLTTVSVNVVRSRIVSKIFQISTDVTGVNCIKSAQVSMGMSMSSGATGMNLVVKRNALSNASFILQGVNGKNIVKIGQSNSLSNITISAFGGNIVKKSDIEPGGFGFVVTASTEGFNAVKLGTTSSEIEIISTGGFTGNYVSATTYIGFTPHYYPNDPNSNREHLGDTIILVRKDGITEGQGRAKRVNGYNYDNTLYRNNIFGFSSSTYQDDLSSLTTLEPTEITDVVIDDQVSYWLKTNGELYATKLKGDHLTLNSYASEFGFADTDAFGDGLSLIDTDVTKICRGIVTHTHNNSGSIIGYIKNGNLFTIQSNAFQQTSTPGFTGEIVDVVLNYSGLSLILDNLGNVYEKDSSYNFVVIETDVTQISGDYGIKNDAIINLEHMGGSYRTLSISAQFVYHEQHGTSPSNDKGVYYVQDGVLKNLTTYSPDLVRNWSFDLGDCVKISANQLGLVAVGANGTIYHRRRDTEIANPYTDVEVIRQPSGVRAGAIRSGSVSMSFEITVSNGVPQTVSLISPGARQTDAFLNIVGTNDDRVIEIDFYNHTPDYDGTYSTANALRYYSRTACIYVKDLIDPNFTYSVQTKDSFSNYDFFGKNIDFDDLYYPVYNSAQEAIRSGSDYSKPVDDIVLVSENSINVTCLYEETLGNYPDKSEKVVPVYVVATLFEPSQESIGWNLNGTEDYKVWNSNWRFRLIYVDANEDRLVTNNKLDVGTFGGVYSGSTTNTFTGSPYLRSSNGLYQTKEIELGIYYRLGINQHNQNWNTNTVEREYGESIPSGQLGNTDPFASTNRNDLFNIDFNVGLKKFEYYAFTQQNRLVTLPYSPHKIDFVNSREYDLLDNVKEIWHAGDMQFNPATSQYDAKQDPWINDVDVALGVTNGVYGGDNSASFPLPVNILPDGYVRDFPQTFSSQNPGNSRGTPQDYLSNSVLKKNKISAEKISA